jgi:hypothetical protein
MVRVAILLFAFVSCAQAQDKFSANYMMLGCDAYLRTVGKDVFQFEKYSVIGGQCFGNVEALMNVGPYLGADLRFCPPKGANFNQGIHVVAAYIRKIPQRTHENFLELAVEALRSAWPCR